MSSTKNQINIKKGSTVIVSPLLDLIGFLCIELFLISKVTTLSTICISKQTTRFTKMNEESVFPKKSALHTFR